LNFWSKAVEGGLIDDMALSFNEKGHGVDGFWIRSNVIVFQLTKV